MLNRLTNMVDAVGTTKYDSIGQLKVANSTVDSEDRGYTYDAAWNLNWRTNNGSEDAFTVDANNQLTADTSCVEDDYDSNGNLTVRKVNVSSYITPLYEYAYDDENRLVTVVFSTNIVGGCLSYVQQIPISSSQFVYDGLGRLRARSEYQWAPGDMGHFVLVSTTEYIYDGKRVIQERDGDNNPLVSYTRGPDLSGSMEGAGGIGGLLARSVGTNHSYYFADGNGNITYMLDSSQSMVANYRYDPFGNTVSQSGSLADANVYRFSSKEIHVPSGMYYYGYRFYDPNLQRWLNRDPIAEAGGINLYEFVFNNPNGTIDPLGLGTIIITRPDGSTTITTVPSQPKPPWSPPPLQPPPPPACKKKGPKDCWGSLATDKLAKIPILGPGKLGAAEGLKTGCVDCCAANFFQGGGEFNQCLANCEAQYLKMIGHGINPNVPPGPQTP